jgi:hypothetical protein
MISLSTLTHGALDYLFGIFMISAPWWMGYGIGGPETWIPASLTMIILFYNLLTDYEGGVVRLLPINVHLLLDMMLGSLLAASPWIFGFNGIASLPQLLIGGSLVFSAMVTLSLPEYALKKLD